MVRAVSLAVAGLLAATCSPAAREPSPPPAPAPAVTRAPAPVASIDDVADAPDAAAADAGKLDWLAPLRFLGPEKGLGDLCGPKCKVERTLPNVAPFKKLILAVGSDPLDSRNPNVRTTHVVFEASDGWYGASILKVGKGTQDVEMINPPSSGMAPFGHMNRRVEYNGRIGRVREIEDETTKAKLVAVELTRSDGIELGVLLLCGAGKDGHPACGELQSDAKLPRPRYEVADGVLEVKWQDGESGRFRVFYGDQ
jgi:hypothetical protein